MPYTYRVVASPIGRVFATSVTAFLCAIALHAATEQSPGRFDDAEYWSLIERASEPDGQFRFDTLISNERMYQVVIPALVQAVPQGGVYIGVGPEQNLTYIAAVRPRLAFIIDIRRDNTLLHLFYKALFELSDDRASFLSRLFARLRPAGLDEHTASTDLLLAYCDVPSNQEWFERTLSDVLTLLSKRYPFNAGGQDAASIRRMYSVFRDFGARTNYWSDAGGITVKDPYGRPMASPCDSSVRAPWSQAGFVATYADLMTTTDHEGRQWSYLAGEERFQFLRDLHRRNLIVPLTGDFGGAHAIRTVSEYLKAHDAAVSVFYTSNVEEYLWHAPGGLSANGSARAFYANVAALPRYASAMFVRSGPGAAGQFMSPIEETLSTVAEGKVRGFSDIVSMSR